jgi:hypothetical protein
MYPRPARTRVLFFVVLSSIAAVYVVGRLWMAAPSEPAPSTEAGLAPMLRVEPDAAR